MQAITKPRRWASMAILIILMLYPRLSASSSGAAVAARKSLENHTNNNNPNVNSSSSFSSSLGKFYHNFSWRANSSWSSYNKDDSERRRDHSRRKKKRREIENNKKNQTIQWPVKHSVVFEGDLVLGALMMVHEREDTITCGPIMPQGGIQAVEAMIFTLNHVNERMIVPGVKIGALILDDCDKDTYGLEMAVDFIKGEFSDFLSSNVPS